MIGVSSFSNNVNQIINGWQKNKFIIIAARPSMGKTGYCLNEVYKAAVQGFQVNLFSLEMTAEEVFKILASIHCGIFLDKFNGKMSVTPEEVQIWFKAHEYICTLPISIKALSTQTVNSMKSHCRAKKRENALPQICFIDYIQLMTNDDKTNKGQNREQDVSQLSRGLKNLSGDAECPVIAFAQLSRAVEIRGGNKIPQLSDLRESGSLEQDADIVGFLYRPEYYDIVEDENGESTKDLAQIIFKKHRGGVLGEAKLHYCRQNQKMTDWGEERENKIIKNGYETTAIYPDGSSNIITRASAQNPEDADLPF
jgi:replicative DNA helicase